MKERNKKEREGDKEEKEEQEEESDLNSPPYLLIFSCHSQLIFVVSANMRVGWYVSVVTCKPKPINNCMKFIINSR